MVCLGPKENGYETMEGSCMKVDRGILGGAAAVQFCSLALVADPGTRPIGFVVGTITGLVLLLLALGVQRGIFPHLGGHSRANGANET